MIKNFVRKILPVRLQVFLSKRLKFIISVYLKSEIRKTRILQERLIEELRDKERINVIFLVIFDSVWKYEEVYELLNKDSKFNVKVVVVPLVREGRAVMDIYTKTLDYFVNKGYNTVSSFDEKNESWLDVKSLTSPDIVLFSLPYNYTYDIYTINNYLDKLTCYVQYAFMSANDYETFFNGRFHNLLWSFFCETPIHKKISQQYALNKGSNVIITGYPGCDKLIGKDYKSSNLLDIEKSKLKKIIWAPHHLMKEGSRQSNFLENYNLIFEIARKYSDRINIFFKPHPLLKEKLYSYPEWGRKRTNNYFKKLKETPNIQIEEGDYVDLFLSSDAMIHDCGSFITEYIYTKKPCLFMVRNIENEQGWNEYGNSALAVLYHSHTNDDVINFIENVVLNEKDDMKDIRLKFLKDVIIPPEGNTASKNIYNTLLKKLNY